MIEPTPEEIAHADTIHFTLKVYREADDDPGLPWCGFYRLAGALHPPVSVFGHSREEVEARALAHHRAGIAAALRQQGGVQAARERAAKARAARKARAEKLSAEHLEGIDRALFG